MVGDKDRVEGNESESKSGGGSWLIEDAVNHAIDTASSMLGGGSSSSSASEDDE